MMENVVSKWHMHRMGMIDFWYYVNEEFHFKDGHMLLRGSNGSGKSVTMQSFLPLLLDGNKSSERLDPFGTRSRKMENYLLDDNGERNDRIGYLYLEFKRENSEVYKTIGMGMHARVGKPLDTWYFVIENNQRINRDISLMEHNVAISKQVLKNRIGEEQLIETQSEYMNRVNQALFGFETLDAYKEAINLLLQLRSPKLSNSLRPTKINEILSASLQPLSEDDLRPMSEAISNMDNLKDQLDALKLSVASAKSIYQVFDAYNHALLFEKEEAFKREYEKTEEIKKKYQQTKEHLQKLKSEYNEKQETLTCLKNENSLLLEEKNSLGNENMQQLVEEIERLQMEMEQNEKNRMRLENHLEEKSNQLQDARTKYQEYVKKAEMYVYEIKKIRAQLEELQETISFEDYALLNSELFEHLDQAYNFDYIKSRVNTRIQKLQNGLREFEHYDLHKTQYDEVLLQHEKHQQCQIEQEKKVEQLEAQYDGVVEESREIISQWVAQNELLCFTNDEIVQMMKILSAYEEERSFYKLNTFVQQAYTIAHKKLLSEEVQLRQDLANVTLQYEEKYQEYLKWKKQKEVEPLQRETQRKNREYLSEKGISYRSFYKILDFDEGMPKEVKNSIEEALLNIGILDALLVEESQRLHLQRTGMEDHYLFINQHVEQLPVYTITGTTMEMAEQSFFKILEQLGQKIDKNIHLADQYYQNGLLYGTLSQTIPSTFIGIKTRIKYREEMMAQLQKECDELQKQTSEVEQLIIRCKDKQQLLEDEKNACLKEDALHTALIAWKNEENILENMYLRNKEIEKEIARKREILENSGKALQKMGQELGIRVQKIIFKEILDGFVEFKELYDLLQVQHVSYMYQLDLQRTQGSLQEDLYLAVDELRDSLDKALQENTKISALFAQKQKQLQDMGYEEVCNRLKEVEKQLQQLPSKIESIVYTLAQIETTQTNLIQQQKEKEDALFAQTERMEKFYQILLDEVALGYVPLEKQENICDQIEKLKVKIENRKRSEILKNELQTVYYTQRGNLQEYQLTITSEEAPVEEFSLRIDVQAKYKGKRISFQELLELLQRDVELQSNLLEDSDRHLFEDILVNTISKKIRLRIFNSRNWIAKMNRYIDSMNTSSGLVIHLQWKSKKAESEEELDTKQLVDLLEKEPRMLKDADVKKLSTHFRSKIATARKLQSLEDNTLSFHQLMKQIMDYREWYEFKILAQKTGEPKKELTNTAFYAYSGGEKAMTMYVPLFSAVAAKFESAREDAPLLIALDEAFAGVDEKNIDSMFSLIAKCKFDYIMNSQVLWGDYPSVKGLAIYELFRPENAKFVTVISYEWDGHIKKLKADM